MAQEVAHPYPQGPTKVASLVIWLERRAPSKRQKYSGFKKFTLMGHFLGGT